jgi:ribosomal protein L7/L12
MKLDKIRFAELIGYCAGRGMTVDKTDVIAMDDIIDIEVPAFQSFPMLNPEALNFLMALMAEGTQKIEAIRQYRMLTGAGLKESKDIVEKYWNSGKPDRSMDMIRKIDEQQDAALFAADEDKKHEYILDGLTHAQLNKVRDFINSFS